MNGEPLAGIPAHLLVADVELDSAEYVVSNGAPGVAKPHVLTASVLGEPTVFEEAAIVYAPLTKVVVASTSCTVSVYPLVLLQLIVMASFALDSTALAPGAKRS